MAARGTPVAITVAVITAIGAVAVAIIGKIGGDHASSAAPPPQVVVVRDTLPTQSPAPPVQPASLSAAPRSPSESQPHAKIAAVSIRANPVAAPGDPGGVQPLSHTCRLANGLAESFVGVPGATPGPVGAPCHDDQGAPGTIIADGSAGPMSSRCKFQSGAVIDYAPRPKIPVGTPCRDVAGNSGQVIP